MGARRSHKRGRADTSQKTRVKVREAKPWERQPEEPVTAFEAFVIYRDMENRTLSGVGQILHKAGTAVERMSSKFQWVERARQWDNELDRRLREVDISEAKKMVKRQIGLAQAVQNVAAMEITALIKRIEAVETQAKMTGQQRVPLITARDMVRLVDSGTKLERLNRGMPDDIQGYSDAQGEPLSTIKIEFVKPEGGDVKDGNGK